MSAIGSYAVLRRSGYAKCLELARNIKTETTGKWIFKVSKVVGVEEFQKEWLESLVEEVDFNYSGYIVGNYLDAHDEISGPLYDQNSEPCSLLAKVFTAAFPFEESYRFPELPSDKLLAFCSDEYGEADSQGMAKAIKAAEPFYSEGIGKISTENLVVFIIR